MAYRGLSASLPIGQLGFSGSKNPTQLQAGHLIEVDGLDLDGDLLQKEGGAAKLNSAALGAPSAIRAGFSWAPTPGTYHTIVFCANGSAYRDTGSGAFATTLKSGMTDATKPPPMFVPGGGETVGASLHLFMFSGTNQVQEITGAGATMQAIDTPAADWASNYPTFGCLHAGRLWGGGNSNDPHRLYYSELGDHEDFVNTNSGSLAIYPGEGEKLVGAFSFRGVLIAFKYPTGIYVVDTRDPIPANWFIQKLSDSVGALNGSSIIHTDRDVIWMDASGHINALTLTTAIGDTESSDIGGISRIGTFIRSKANLAELQRAVAIWYPLRRQAWFSFPTGTGTTNDLRLIADFSAPNVGPSGETIPRFLKSSRDTTPSMWMRRYTDTTLRPVSGDSSGFVWLMDQEARDKAGVAYPMRFETANTDLGFLDPRLAMVQKTGQFLELVTEPTGDWSATVEIYWDDVLTDTKLFSAGFGSSILDSFTLDTGVLGSTAIRSERQRIAGSGRRLKLIVYNTGLDQNVKISEFVLSFVAMDERDTGA